MDLAGTYSLAPRSPDELVAVEVLTANTSEQSGVNLIVCVVNALLLQRNLFLVSQLLELGKPVVVALNMIDVAESRGMQIDVKRLSEQIGVPVVATSAAKRTGIDSLKEDNFRSAEQGSQTSTNVSRISAGRVLRRRSNRFRDALVSNKQQR